MENCYLYDHWGKTIAAETAENIDNLYRFANYVWDGEINQYYCNARQYDPLLARFISRDPVQGNFTEPMTFDHQIIVIPSNTTISTCS